MHPITVFFFSFEGLSKKASLVCGLKVNLIDIYIVVMTVTTFFHTFVTLTCPSAC